MMNKTLDNLAANMGEISFFTATTLGAAISGGDIANPLFAFPAACQLISGMYNHLNQNKSREFAYSSEESLHKQKSINDSGDILYGITAEMVKVALAGAIGYEVLSRWL